MTELSKLSIFKQLLEKGYCVISDLFDADEIENMKKKIESKIKTIIAKSLKIKSYRSNIRFISNIKR